MKFNIIACFVVVCDIVSALIAVYAFRHRTARGARSFAFFMVSMVVYIFGYSLELAGPSFEWMLFWNKFQYIGILSFPTLYLIFTIQFAGHEKWLTRRRIILLFVIPAFLMIAKLFDDQLKLIYASVELDRNGFFPVLSFTKGPLYLVSTVYNLLMVTIGSILLWQKRHYGSALYRKQTGFLLAASLVAYLVFLIYLSGITIVPGLEHLDWNPLVYLLWGAAIGYTIFRYRLFTLTPIARDNLIMVMSDGVVVLDAQARIVDVNPEAQRIFAWQKPPIGQPGAKMMENWFDLAFLEQIEKPTKIETNLTKAGRTIYYEVTLSAFWDEQDKRIGYLVVVHDISKRKEFEKELHELSLADELTGLTNRRGFNLLAPQLINVANRVEMTAALFYVDMDGLKGINDTLGHAAGDQAIKETAIILKDTFRSSDIVVRLGGDEFVVLALETADNSGEVMHARLMELLKHHNQEANRSYQLSFSVGMARYVWKNPQTLDLLLEEADKAMYAEKLRKSGRNRSQ